MLGSNCPFGYWCGGIGLIGWLGSCGLVSVVCVQSKVEVSSLCRSRGNRASPYPLWTGLVMTLNRL